jgi:predicted dehydrogenase
MGADHARTLSHSVGGATLAAVYDTDRQRARAVAHDLGAEVLTSDEELIACPKVDAVIASHDSAHAGQVLKCIEVGKL